MLSALKRQHDEVLFSIALELQVGFIRLIYTVLNSFTTLLFSSEPT